MDGFKSTHDIITNIIKSENEKILWKIADNKFRGDKDKQQKFVDKYLKENYYTLNILKKGEQDPIMLYYKTLKKCV